MRRTTWIGVFLVLAGLLASGCKSNDAPSKYEQAHDAFDTPADPPLTARTHVAAGMLAESQGDFDRAGKQYREALKLEPANHDAIFHLAAVLTQQKQFPEAISLWQRYLPLVNNAPAGYYDLAACYEAAGQIDKAEATYRAGMAQNPTDTTCRQQYGLMLARQGRFDEATAQLTPLLKPADISCRFGFVLERQGKPDQAKAWYIKALQQDPTMNEPKARLAVLK